MSETPRQRAKREKKVYIEILIDSRFVNPRGARIALKGPFDPEHANAFYAAVWHLIAKHTPVPTRLTEEP